ncbi:quercetin dioxygenase-like cupin family protein [Peptoniphilus koenoeneniae]|uniref:Quercetin dioxygenase-like cupin family protein n=1 Tax=Peptoniphilus koenoeneniae TaxID=507751 RepID=A0ABU0ASZ9_9FIRM|nr:MULTISPECIES: cupin domain-containing protein [Peptoniphilus]ERT60187.1 cupin domain protein [Peptoniphilus sp. BV3C26]MDQ0274391.1 quercetin dioxygenase-like cupin family protein [Peptoniphilus koenoeneniae]
MNEKTGEVFSIAKDNQPVPGCTISKAVYSGINDIIYFSLAKNTDISAEIYPYYKLLVVADGNMEVYGTDGFSKKIEKEESIVTLTDVPMGIRTSEGAVYTEIMIRKEDIMNEAIKAGEVFKLADLVPYAEGKIVNMDVAHNDKMKFVVMAFDEGTGLSEHAAPGEAIIFALDGEGVIGYEGKEHPIKAGENFHFAKAGLHSVKATKKFKMALLLTLE